MADPRAKRPDLRACSWNVVMKQPRHRYRLSAGLMGVLMLIASGPDVVRPTQAMGPPRTCAAFSNSCPAIGPAN
jgi:hypothetical protein